MNDQASASAGPASSTYQDALRASIRTLEQLRNLEPALQTAAAWCMETFAAGGKILTFGNGGSAAQAQHLAAEFIGRYRGTRRPLPTIALTSDSTALTCIANDFDYEVVFARQIEALASRGDLVIAFSTSGVSANVVRALETSQRLRVRSIAFLGGSGGNAAALADCPLIVAHTDTARIQEGHTFLTHALMDAVEAALSNA